MRRAEVESFISISIFSAVAERSGSWSIPQTIGELAGGDVGAAD